MYLYTRSYRIVDPDPFGIAVKLQELQAVANHIRYYDRLHLGIKLVHLGLAPEQEVLHGFEQRTRSRLYAVTQYIPLLFGKPVLIQLLQFQELVYLADGRAQIVADDAEQFGLGLVGFFQFVVELRQCFVLMIQQVGRTFLIAIDDEQQHRHQQEQSQAAGQSPQLLTGIRQLHLLLFDLLLLFFVLVLCFRISQALLGLFQVQGVLQQHVLPGIPVRVLPLP